MQGTGVNEEVPGDLCARGSLEHSLQRGRRIWRGAGASKVQHCCLLGPQSRLDPAAGAT